MHASFDAAPAPFDWQRVAAFCTTFAAHLAAVALIAAPLAMPPAREIPKPVEASLIFTPTPPPSTPPPPEPAPPPRAHLVRHLLPTPAPPPPTTSTAPADAAPPALTPTASAPTPATNVPVAAGISDIGPASPAGETRTLAYDGALRLAYPVASLRAREQGSVLLRVLVDEHGAPQRIEIARSSGHPKLDAAAREAVRSARFRPVLRAGQPAPAWGLVPIEFRLDRA